MPTTTVHATPPTTPRPAHAIEVRDLTTHHDGRVVVDQVSFTVEEGEVFAILGPNGSGKSTIVESIAGLRTPDTGTIRVHGHDPIADRAAVRDLLDVQLQGRSLRDRPSVRDVLAGRPRTVVLDEPTTGLDPQSRREALALVEDLRDGGVTVVLVTRSTDEAERLADRLALVDRGRVIALDTPYGVVDGAGLEQQVRVRTAAGLDEGWIRRLPEVSGVVRERGEFVVTGTARMLFSVVSLLAAHDIVPGRLEVDQPTLGDAFVALAGRPLHGDDTPEAR